MNRQAGISANDNLPAGLPNVGSLKVPGGSDSVDALYDLERMLGVLRELSGLGGLRPTAEPYLGPTAEPIEVLIELELDAAAPHLDLVRQLAHRIERVVARRGVVLGRTLVELLEGIAVQARRAWIARHGPG